MPYSEEYIKDKVTEGLKALHVVCRSNFFFFSFLFVICEIKTHDDVPFCQEPSLEILAD